MGIVGGKKIKVGKWHEMPRKSMYLGNGVILSDDTPNSLAEAGQSEGGRAEGRDEWEGGGRGRVPS